MGNITIHERLDYILPGAGAGLPGVSGARQSPHFQPLLSVPGGGASKMTSKLALGPPGSEAVNVSCEIHDAAAMTCTWEAGPTAPPDARYFLVLRNAT